MTLGDFFANSPELHRAWFANHRGAHSSTNRYSPLRLLASYHSEVAPLSVFSLPFTILPVIRRVRSLDAIVLSLFGNWKGGVFTHERASDVPFVFVLSPKAF